MKIFNNHPRHILVTLLTIAFCFACEKETPITGTDEIPVPENYGTLEISFKLPVYNTIQSGIRRVDLGFCYSMEEMYKGIFFYHLNVSDAKELYTIKLPEGRYYYQAIITCTCGGDSCIQGGFPYGYGGMQYTFKQVDIVRGKSVQSQPVFQ